MLLIIPLHYRDTAITAAEFISKHFIKLSLIIDFYNQVRMKQSYQKNMFLYLSGASTTGKQSYRFVCSDSDFSFHHTFSLCQCWSEFGSH